MTLHTNFIPSLCTLRTHPRLWRSRLEWLSFIHVSDGGKLLQKADEEEGCFVVGELLPKTDTWAGVEREEDEWVGGEVFLQTVIDEAVGVEFVRCGGRISEVRESEMGD